MITFTYRDDDSYFIKVNGMTYGILYYLQYAKVWNFHHHAMSSPRNFGPSFWRALERVEQFYTIGL